MILTIGLIVMEFDVFFLFYVNLELILLLRKNIEWDKDTVCLKSSDDPWLT